MSHGRPLGAHLRRLGRLHPPHVGVRSGRQATWRHGLGRCWGGLRGCPSCCVAPLGAHGAQHAQETRESSRVGCSHARPRCGRCQLAPHTQWPLRRPLTAHSPCPDTPMPRVRPPALASALLACPCLPNVPTRPRFLSPSCPPGRRPLSPSPSPTALVFRSLSSGSSLPHGRHASVAAVCRGEPGAATRGGGGAETRRPHGGRGRQAAAQPGHKLARGEGKAERTPQEGRVRRRGQRGGHLTPTVPAAGCAERAGPVLVCLCLLARRPRSPVPSPSPPLPSLLLASLPFPLPLTTGQRLGSCSGEPGAAQLHREPEAQVAGGSVDGRVGGGGAQSGTSRQQHRCRTGGTERPGCTRCSSMRAGATQRRCGN